MITMPIATGYDPGNFLSRAILKIECQIGSDWVKFLNKNPMS